MASDEFEGHGVVVVGAGEGIGKHVAISFASWGARVACLDLSGDGAQATADEASRFTAASFALEMDVKRQDSVDAAISQVVDVFGKIDILINCAGITGVTSVQTHDVPVDSFDEVCAVNLRGAFLLSRAVLPRMLQSGYGRILHVASIAGKEGNAGMVSYSASKAGLIGMVKSQGKEYAESGITINALAPAVIQTAMVDAMPDEQVLYMTSRIPMNRCGTLSEAANVIRWIVSPQCSFTTGFTFDLSGGRAVY